MDNQFALIFFVLFEVFFGGSDRIWVIVVDGSTVNHISERVGRSALFRGTGE